MSNLSGNLVGSARDYPDRLAIRMDEQTLTFAELDDAAARAAAALTGLGVRSGDRVGLMLPNVPAFAILYYGAMRLGAVVVPMNPLLRSREVEYYLTDSGAVLLCGWHEVGDEASAGAQAAGVRWMPVSPDTLEEFLYRHAPALGVVDCAGDETAVILYTSGTTGKPKGAELTHDNLDNNREIAGRTLLHVGPDDVVMGCLPLFHVFGMTAGLNVAIAAGACLTLIPRFDPVKALEVIDRDRVTVFEGVPTMYGAVLGVVERASYDVTTLRTCVSGGAALPVELLRNFEQAFGCTILEGYGLSETSPIASFSHPDAERKPGSIGTPIEGVRMRVVDDVRTELGAGEIGEIEIYGHNVMKGYWGKPLETSAAIEDGWFRTGDLARTDDDGYFYIVDRKKDLIIRGGYNVYPREVEEVLYEHPAVAEAAVIGIAHDTLGEEIGAAVALRPGMAATAEELASFVKERLAAYKYPRRVWLVSELPKGPTGKILRREVTAPTSEPAPAIATTWASPRMGDGADLGDSRS